MAYFSELFSSLLLSNEFELSSDVTLIFYLNISIEQIFSPIDRIISKKKNPETFFMFKIDFFFFFFQRLLLYLKNSTFLYYYVLCPMSLYASTHVHRAIPWLQYAW